MGDVFSSTGYPFIDSDNGGDLDGTIEFCKRVLAELAPPTKAELERAMEGHVLARAELVGTYEKRRA